MVIFILLLPILHPISMVKMQVKAPVSASEIRKTIATSMGAAFGIVIGMVWTQVVMGIFSTGGINLTSGATAGNWKGLGLFVITAMIVTLACVIAIIYIGKWGNKSK